MEYPRRDLRWRCEVCFWNGEASVGTLSWWRVGSLAGVFGQDWDSQSPVPELLEEAGGEAERNCVRPRVWWERLEIRWWYSHDRKVKCRFTGKLNAVKDLGPLTCLSLSLSGHWRELKCWFYKIWEDTSIFFFLSLNLLFQPLRL